MKTFGRPNEVIFLSGLAALLGLVFIWRLRDWNSLGQAAWSMTLVFTPLFLAYAYSVILAAHLLLRRFSRP